MEGGLGRLARPLIVTCIDCLLVAVVWSSDIALSNISSKHVGMSNYLEVARSSSGVGLGSSMSSVVANSVSHLLARAVARGSSLESVDVTERRCSEDSACKSLRR